MAKAKTTFAWSIDTSHFQGQQSQKLHRSEYSRVIPATEIVSPGDGGFGNGDPPVYEVSEGNILHMTGDCSICVSPAPPAPTSCDTSYKPKGFQGSPYNIKTEGTMSAPAEISELYTHLAANTTMGFPAPDVRYGPVVLQGTYNGTAASFSGDYKGIAYDSGDLVGIADFVEGADITSYVQGLEGGNFIQSSPRYKTLVDRSPSVWELASAELPYTWTWVDKAELGMEPGTPEVMGPTGNLLVGMGLDLNREKVFLEEGPTHRTVTGACKVAVSEIQHASALSRIVGSGTADGVAPALLKMPAAPIIGQTAFQLDSVFLDAFTVHKITDVMAQGFQTAHFCTAYRKVGYKGYLTSALLDGAGMKLHAGWAAEGNPAYALYAPEQMAYVRAKGNTSLPVNNQPTPLGYTQELLEQSWMAGIRQGPIYTTVPSTVLVPYHRDDHGSGWDNHSWMTKASHRRIDSVLELEHDVSNHMGSSTGMVYPVPGFTPHNWRYYRSGVGYYYRYGTFDGTSGGQYHAPTHIVLTKSPSIVTQAEIDSLVDEDKWKIYKQTPSQGGLWVYEQPDQGQYSNTKVLFAGDYTDEQRNYQEGNDLSQYCIEWYNSTIGPSTAQSEWVPFNYQNAAATNDALPWVARTLRSKAGYSANVAQAIREVDTITVRATAYSIWEGGPGGNPKDFYGVDLQEIWAVAQANGVWIAPDPNYYVDFTNWTQQSAGGNGSLFSLLPVNRYNSTYFTTGSGYGSQRITKAEMLADLAITEEQLVGYSGSIGVPASYGMDYTWSGQDCVGGKWYENIPRTCYPEVNFGNSAFPNTPSPNDQGQDTGNMGMGVREMAYAEAVWYDIGGSSQGGTTLDEDPPVTPDPASTTKFVVALNAVDEDNNGPQVEGKWAHSTSVTSQKRYFPLYEQVSWDDVHGFSTGHPFVDGERISAGTLFSKWSLGFSGSNFATSLGEMEAYAQSLVDARDASLRTAITNGQIYATGTCTATYVTYDMSQNAVILESENGLGDPWAGWWTESDYHEYEEDSAMFPTKGGSLVVLERKGIELDLHSAPAERSAGTMADAAVLTSMGITVPEGVNNLMDYVIYMNEYLLEGTGTTVTTDPIDGAEVRTYREIFWPVHVEDTTVAQQTYDDLKEEWDAASAVWQSYQRKENAARATKIAWEAEMVTAQDGIDNAEDANELAFWEGQLVIATTARDVAAAKEDAWEVKADDAKDALHLLTPGVQAANAILQDLDTAHRLARSTVRDLLGYVDDSWDGFVHPNISKYMVDRRAFLDRGYTLEDIKRAHPAVFLNGSPKFEGDVLWTAILFGMLTSDGMGQDWKDTYAAAYAVSDATYAEEGFDWADVEYWWPGMVAKKHNELGDPYEQAIEATKAFGPDFRSNNGWTDISTSWTDVDHVSFMEVEGKSAGHAGIEYWMKGAGWSEFDGTNVQLVGTGPGGDIFHYVHSPFIGSIGWIGNTNSTYVTENFKGEDVSVCANSYGLDATNGHSGSVPDLGQGYQGYAWAGDRGESMWPDFHVAQNAQVAGKRYWAEISESGDCKFTRKIGGAAVSIPENPGGSVAPGDDKILTWSTHVDHWSPTSSQQLELETKSPVIEFGQNERITVELLEEDGEVFTEQERLDMIQQLEDEPQFRRPKLIVFENQPCHIQIDPVDPHEVQQYYYEEPMPTEEDPNAKAYTWPLYVLEADAEVQDLFYQGAGAATEVTFDSVVWYHPATLFVEGDPPADPDADPPIPEPTVLDIEGTRIEHTAPPEDLLFLSTTEKP